MSQVNSRPLEFLRTSTRFSAIAYIFLALSSANAEDKSIKDDAKQVGHAVGSAAHDVGQGAKKAGKEIAQTPKKVGKAVGHKAKEGVEAVKEGGKELKRAVTGDH